MHSKESFLSGDLDKHRFRKGLFTFNVAQKQIMRKNSLLPPFSLVLKA